MRKEHPLVVALVEAFARKAGIEPPTLWAALDGKPADPGLVAGLVEAFHPVVRETDFVALPARPKNGTLRTMSATAFATPVKGRPTEHGKHPLIRALKKDGLTLTEVAKDVGRSPASMRSWLYPVGDASFRPIPRACAEHFRDKYKVPLATWPRIAD